MRNEEVLRRVKKDRNKLRTLKRRKVNWFGRILLRKCLLKHVIKRKVGGGNEVTGRRCRRRRQLLDAFNEKRIYRKLKEEALDPTL